MTLFVMSASERIAKILDEKTPREHFADARELGLGLAEYYDRKISGLIDHDYKRGLITETEAAALRREWGV